MRQLDLLDALDEGEAALRRCAEKAEREGFDAEAASQYVLVWLAIKGEATGEEMVDAAIEAGFVPHDGRAFGGVIKRLAARGVIRRVGFALRRKGHGTAGASVWKASA